MSSAALTTTGTAPASHSGRQGPRRLVSAAIAAGLVGLVLLWGADRTEAPPSFGEELPGDAAWIATDRSTLRVATFNIHGGRNAAGESNLELTAATVTDFDIVALQEVRGAWPWQDGDQARLLGQRLKLGWLFAPTERRWWRDDFGNGLLSRSPCSWRSESLVNTRGKAYRNVIRAAVAFRGRTVTVLATHLDRQADRPAQLRAVAEMFLEAPEPAILLGDLNTTAANPLLADLLARPSVSDVFRAAGVEGDAERIDWILVRGLKVISAGTRNLAASDHPAVWAELACPDEPASSSASRPAR